jgi:hypothetical protein
MFNGRLSRCPPAVLTLLALLVLPGAGPGILATDPLWAQGSATPAQVQFEDFGSRIRSDGAAYVDGQLNVICSVEKVGSTFLRTMSPYDGVGYRSITLDFSDLIPGRRSTDFPDCLVPEQDENPDDNYSLDTCGPNDLMDVRCYFLDLFKRGAACTRLTLYFSKNRDFQGSADFSLEFACVPISGTGNVRVLEASGAQATATLYRHTAKNRGTTTRDWIADYTMPFKCTVTRL